MAAPGAFGRAQAQAWQPELGAEAGHRHGHRRYAVLPPQQLRPADRALRRQTGQCPARRRHDGPHQRLGLAKLLLFDATGGTESTIGIRGTIGYVAPGNNLLLGRLCNSSTSVTITCQKKLLCLVCCAEYGTTGSYGLTLLEILPGKGRRRARLRHDAAGVRRGGIPERIEQWMSRTDLSLFQLPLFFIKKKGASSVYSGSFPPLTAGAAS